MFPAAHPECDNQAGIGGGGLPNIRGGQMGSDTHVPVVAAEQTPHPANASSISRFRTPGGAPTSRSRS